ncbi:hypothetical protein LZ32DRAFT_613488 [Colletotrichum eremochloae]|nr:hypothetical protein LZ32DRAFT_613488 [Colletotrichum eremochloae]
MYYKAIDVEKVLFTKWKIADDSSAHIAIGDFTGHSKLDLISVEYNVPMYYEEPTPTITLHTNRFAKPKLAATDRQISLPLIEVSNYSISVAIHPHGAKIALGLGDGIEVLYGSVASIEGTLHSTSAPAFPQAALTTSDDSEFSADKDRGAIVLRIVAIDEPGVWTKAEDVPLRTTFSTKALGIESPDFNFIKAEELWWGKEKPQLKGVGFTNLSGFHFCFQDDEKDANFPHAILDSCRLSPGTGDGGIWRLKDGKKPTSAMPVYFDKLPLPRLFEHGGLWARDSNSHAVRRTNNIIA